MRNIYGNLIPRLKRCKELLIWMLHKTIERSFFSADVSQCNVAFSVVHVQVYFKCFFTC